MSDEYEVTGRIRDNYSNPCQGYTVHAFDKDPRIYGHPDDRLGVAKTDDSGSFKITFGVEAFKDWFESNPKVYLVCRDEMGRVMVQTPDKENKTRAVDFQIKLAKNQINPLEPDIYANGLERMVAAFRNIGDSVDLSKNDVVQVSTLVIEALTSWSAYRSDLERLQGYDGVQAPEQPRKEKHEHVTRWDEAVLPV